MNEKVDEIECPHCNYLHVNYDDYLEVGDMSGEFEMDCEECGESFNVDFFSLFIFTSTTI
jgi:transcription elongation factor Elf1